MATPSLPAPPVGPETMITVKVLQNNSINRRFKIPLRDLGARVFPERVRDVLQVPAGEKLILERYSDSAVRYVLLDSETPAVYKQLYRAAKAKLKLRIKATTRPKPEGTPLPGVAPALKAEQLLNETGQRYSYLDTVLSAPLSTTMSTSPSAGKAPGATPAASNVDMDIPIPSDFSLFEHRPRHFALGPEKRSYPLMFPAKESSNAAFCIDCNHCGASIPGEHYHCSICDEGDYDLCAVCVDAGITCPGEDHWLLKRLVQNGVIVNSTTETIAPRQPEPEVVVKAEGSTDESKEATEVKPEVKIESRTEEPVDENPEAVEERTCNACFKEFAEAKMVTCDDCEDYDLCITCLLKDSHGHHPAHTLSLIEDHDFCLKNLVLLRCRPGRQYHHAAICDGCDQRIVGVRHRCLSCPDWDYCWSCIKDAGKAHPGHRFVPLYGAIANPLAHHETHYGIICDGPLCQKRLTSTYVTGVRYKCAVCHDTDFCAACEACPTNEHNRTHPLIKFQTPVRSVQVSTLGDDGFGGPVMSMGDRLGSSTWHLNELSSARSTVVEKQTVKEEPTEDQSATEVATVSEKVKDVEEQSEVPATEVGMEEKSDNATPSEQTPEYQAFFMRDTIADGTVLSPQEVFQQTWTLYNPGPSSWPVGSSVRFVGGDTMFNVDTQHPSSANSLVSAMASNELTAPVAPGESADFCVTLKTSQREGTSISYWRLKLSDGTPFGHKLWCDVTVRAGADTLTKVLREVEAEPVLSRSNMIFPKLEKESPVSSTHEAMTQTPAAPSAPSAPSLANADEQDVLEDVESLALEDVETDTDGFLTDEEYDILDASDQEFSTDKHD